MDPTSIVKILKDISLISACNYMMTDNYISDYRRLQSTGKSHETRIDDSNRFTTFQKRSVPVRFVNPLGLLSQLLANRIHKDPASRATRL